ncbi:MAG: hypothetical protein EOP04_09735 [Proteobacteria bacterium]|nr:MAG: hypothetical protein EOP04_09735 [Pseudomonadota bacterium]
MRFLVHRIILCAALGLTSTACKRDSVDNQFSDDIAAKDQPQIIPMNRSANQTPPTESIETPGTTEIPSTDTSEEPNFSVVGVEYALSKGYQDLDCIKFKGFEKNPMSFQVKHSPFGSFTSERRYVKDQPCAITGTLKLPKNYIMNTTFEKTPVAIDYFFEKGDTFSVTYDLRQNVNGTSFGASYVGTLKDPQQLFGVAELSFTSRRELRMECPTDPEGIKSIGEEREVILSLTIESHLQPKANLGENAEEASAQVLNTPSVLFEFQRCPKP